MTISSLSNLDNPIKQLGNAQALIDAIIADIERSLAVTKTAMEHTTDTKLDPLAHRYFSMLQSTLLAIEKNIFALQLKP